MCAAALHIEGATFESILMRAVFESPLTTTRGHVRQSGVIGIPQQGGLADPVLRTLWVYGHEAWVNTLATEPGWLGAVC